MSIKLDRRGESRNGSRDICLRSSSQGRWPSGPFFYKYFFPSGQRNEPMAHGCGQNSVSTGTSMSCIDHRDSMSMSYFDHRDSMSMSSFDHRESNFEYRCRASIIENRTSNIDVVHRSTRIDVELRRRASIIENRTAMSCFDRIELRISMSYFDH